VPDAKAGVCAMRHRVLIAPSFCAAVLAMLWPAPGVSQSQVPASVTSVVSGGFWQSGSQAGRYRVVVVDEGTEHVVSRVFVEWVKDAEAPETGPAVVASVEPELPFGRGLAVLTARLRPLKTGQVEVALAGVMSIQPSKKVQAVLVATRPGEVDVVRRER
jgi:hypothetical protein